MKPKPTGGYIARPDGGDFGKSSCGCIRCVSGALSAKTLNLQRRFTMRSRTEATLACSGLGHSCQRVRPVTDREASGKTAVRLW